jgi:hypothetical protein
MTGKHGSYSGSPADLGNQGITTTFTTHRALDPVRGAALAAAVELLRGAHGDFSTSITRPDYEHTRGQWRPAEASEVLALARTFEAYLTGKEEQQP